MPLNPSKLLAYFREVVIADTEFRSFGDGSFLVRCVCAVELRSGREHRLWIEEESRCPYPTDDRILFVAHYGSAEIGSHLSLRWLIPKNVLDTCVEFSAMTSGLRGRGERRSLLGALRYFGIHTLEDEEKAELRELAMMDKKNAEYTISERRDLLNYCFDDVLRTKRLLRKLEPFLCCRET